MRIAIILLIMFLSACNSAQKQNEQVEKELQERILKIHDRLMPQMETIMSKKQYLTQKMLTIKNVTKEHPSVDTAALSARLSLAVNHLETADHTMMDWMHDFNPDFENKSHAQIMKYLQNEYVKVQAVESGMKAAFKESDSLNKEIQ